MIVPAFPSTAATVPFAFPPLRSWIKTGNPTNEAAMLFRVCWLREGEESCFSSSIHRLLLYPPSCCHPTIPVNYSTYHFRSIQQHRPALEKILHSTKGSASVAQLLTLTTFSNQKALYQPEFHSDRYWVANVAQAIIRRKDESSEGREG